MLREMKLILLGAFFFASATASASEAEDDLTCLNNPPPSQTTATLQGAAYYGAATIPFLLSVMTNAVLSQRIKDRPYLSEILNKIMLPINIALATPIMGPLGSKFQQLCFSVLSPLNKEPFEKNGGALETRWHDTQAAYSVNAQMSRNVYTSLTGRIGTNVNRAKNALSSGDTKYAIDQIAEAAITMRILFAEIKAHDHLVSMTVHLQFTNHVNLDKDFKQKVLNVIAQYDPEFRVNNDNRHFYEEVLREWLN